MSGSGVYEMIYSTFSVGVAPCRGCSDRSALCHAGCDRYKAWRADLKSKRDHERHENMHGDYRRDQCTSYSLRLWKGSRAYKRKYKGVPIKK